MAGELEPSSTGDPFSVEFIDFRFDDLLSLFDAQRTELITALGDFRKTANPSLSLDRIHQRRNGMEDSFKDLFRRVMNLSETDAIGDGPGVVLDFQNYDRICRITQMNSLLNKKMVIEFDPSTNAFEFELEDEYPDLANIEWEEFELDKYCDLLDQDITAYTDYFTNNRTHPQRMVNTAKDLVKNHPSKAGLLAITAIGGITKAFYSGFLARR